MTKEFETIEEHFDGHMRVAEETFSLYQEEIGNWGEALSHSLLNGAAIIWCGNGGSAADSQHLAAELVGRFKKNRKALRSIAITTDSSALTCIANDYSYDDIFSRQLEAIGRPEDVLVAISTSGESENILRALVTAKQIGMQSFGLLGKGGGRAKALCDRSMTIPSDSTARIQEAHILIGHILCDSIERNLGLS